MRARARPHVRASCSLRGGSSGCAAATDPWGTASPCRRSQSDVATGWNATRSGPAHLRRDRGEIEVRVLPEGLAMALAEELVAAHRLRLAVAAQQQRQQRPLDVHLVLLDLGEAGELLRRALEVADRVLDLGKG